MPPPGGTRTPIPVSYFWGAPGTTTGVQDNPQWNAAFQPSGGIFSPNAPLVPIDDERLRIWDYPVGYNFIYTPRSFEPVGFQEIKALAYNHDITRLAIETRKDQIEKLTWEIKPRNEDDTAAEVDKRADVLKEFWEHPDGEQPFATWLREAMESVLVPDAASFEVRRNRGGEIIGLDVVDGSTIKVLIDQTGRRPVPPVPAYEQIIHGRPWRLMTSNELIYSPRNVRPGHVYGFSPVEQILMTVNIALRRQVQQLQYFTDGNIPRGLLNAPDGWSSQQIRQFQEWFDSFLQGNTAERQKGVVAPWGMKYQAFKDPPLKDEFDEWLARVVMFAFSLPPDAFIRQRSRAAAQTAQQQALEEGLAPLMGWVKRFVDGVIQNRMGHKDLEFSWQELKQTDPLDQNTILMGYVKDSIYTINEARDTLGMDPIEGGDEPMFITATGPVFLKTAIAQTEAPPPTPPGAEGTGAPATDGSPAGALDVGADGLPAAGKPTQPDGTREVGKLAAGTFRAPGALKTCSHAQRRVAPEVRAAVAREAAQLLRGARPARGDAGRA